MLLGINQLHTDTAAIPTNQIRTVGKLTYKYRCVKFLKVQWLVKSNEKKMQIFHTMFVPIQYL